MTKTRVRVTSGLLWVLLSLLSFYHPSPANAETTYGLNAVGYVIDQIPPTRSDSAYPTCGSELENNINRSFDWEPFAQCPNDQFMVHYSGYITLPAHQTIEFWIAADDGGTLSINGSEFGDWNDKGCSWYGSGPMDLPAGESLSLDGWFYENGGGTCYMLAWNIDGQGWEIVPDSAFTTTINTVTTTTLEETTTTQTEPPTTTTTTTSTTTTVPDTTTTSTTTTVARTTTTTVPETTTSQLVPPTTTTEPATVVESTTTTTSEPQTTTTFSRPVTTTTTTTLPPQTTQVPTTSSSVLPSTTTTIPVTETITPTQALAVATNAEALKTLTSDEAAKVFDAVVVSELSNEEASQLVEAVQNAPEEVRAQFEEQVNIFDNKFGNYVPIGSKVNVKQRKVIIAATGVLFAVPAVSSSSSTSNASDSRKGRKK